MTGAVVFMALVSIVLLGGMLLILGGIVLFAIAIVIDLIRPGKDKMRAAHREVTRQLGDPNDRP